MLNIGVLISGGGTNLQAIIDETKSGGINGTVKLVISNKENAYGLERARLSKIKAVCETDEDKIIELLKENNIDITLEDEAFNLKKKGQSIIYVARNEELLGVIGIQDKMRENMKKSLNNVRYQGVDEILLLTGDLEDQASIVASKVGVDGYEAELLPEDKAKTILKLQKNTNNKKVLTKT